MPAAIRSEREATSRDGLPPNAKMAGLMIAYIQNPQNIAETRLWCQAIFERLGDGSREAQAARVAFLAAEGLFLLRIAGIDKDGKWSAFFDDVESVFDRLVLADSDG